MISRIELRKNAWKKLRAAQVLIDQRMWEEAFAACGYAVEIMLKASICVAKRWNEFPHSAPEFKACSIKGLKTHEFEFLLNETNQAAKIKSTLMTDWTECLMWNAEYRYYQPPGASPGVSAKKLLKSATIIIKALQEEPGLEAAVAAATDNPYLKIRAVIRETEVEKGQFILASLIHRKGSFSGSSELVLCSPWMEQDKDEAVKYITERVTKALQPSEMTTISGVMILDQNHPFIQTFGRAFGFDKEDQFFLEDVKVNGFLIEAAIIFTSALLDRHA